MLSKGANVTDRLPCDHRGTTAYATTAGPYPWYAIDHFMCGRCGDLFCHKRVLPDVPQYHFPSAGWSGGEEPAVCRGAVDAPALGDGSILLDTQPPTISITARPIRIPCFRFILVSNLYTSLPHTANSPAPRLFHR